jgi:hypothetical protein
MKILAVVSAGTAVVFDGLFAAISAIGIVIAQRMKFFTSELIPSGKKPIISAVGNAKISQVDDAMNLLFLHRGDERRDPFNAIMHDILVDIRDDAHPHLAVSRSVGMQALKLRSGNSQRDSTARLQKRSSIQSTAVLNLSKTHWIFHMACPENRESQSFF